ncbi:ATP F0F1 synthase subunit gamma [Clostridiales bacterium PH28_bin88]|nr:ATP F0F1 synthase subunit gamma [Clostridiales bacterium PH28_bin88]
MPGMRDIKRRIRSIRNTQQITKAMKMVAAAKLRKAQAGVVAARPYADKVREVMERLVQGAQVFNHPLLDVRPRQAVGYVVLTGDRGLCGGYNANIIRLTEQRLRAEEEAKAALVPVGRKGRDYFRRRRYEIIKSFTELGDNPNFIQARELARELVAMYQDGVFDEVNLVYTEFISAIRQRPVVVRLLPVAPPEGEDQGAGEQVEYLYEPSPAGVLDTLLPRYVETQVYRALLEAKASEHGARMTAMGSATDNAAEMIDKLTLSFNRARQAAITKEINEVVSGAQALQ